MCNNKNPRVEVTAGGIGGNGRKDQNFGSRYVSLILKELTITDYSIHTCTTAQ